MCSADEMCVRFKKGVAISGRHSEETADSPHSDFRGELPVDNGEPAALNHLVDGEVRRGQTVDSTEGNERCMLAPEVKNDT